MNESGSPSAGMVFLFVKEAGPLCFYYNSLGGPITEAARRVRDYFMTCFFFWDIPRVIPQIERVAGPKQTDGHNCGMFFLVWVREVFRSLKATRAETMVAIKAITFEQQSLAKERKAFAVMLRGEQP
jgi:hypothetical protein